MLWLPNEWSNAKHVFVSTMLSTVELLEYATWLGMNLPEESELLWVAREGLKAPLPEHWKPWWLHSPSPKYASWLQSIKMNKVVRHLFVIYIQLYGTGQQEKGFGNSKSVLTKVDCPRTCCLVQGDWSWHTRSIFIFFLQPVRGWWDLLFQFPVWRKCVGTSMWWLLQVSAIVPF